MEKQEILDKVLEQVKREVELGDMTALEELLRTIPKDLLQGYLSEVGDG